MRFRITDKPKGEYEIIDIQPEEIGDLICEECALYSAETVSRIFDQIGLRFAGQVNFTQNTASDMASRLTSHGREFFKTVVDRIKEDEEEEVFYKVGDRFTGGSCIYTLSLLSSPLAENKKVVLVEIEGDSGWGAGYIWKSKDCSVKDPKHITQEEFARIANCYPDCFTLIK